VNELLDTAGRDINEKLVSGLRPGGVLCNPMMFARLANHAAKVRLWSQTRPTR
jgi:hypothetical protein